MPDLAVIDVRMPPTLTDDGARAAQQLRSRYSVALVASGGFGYLLKDRVLRVADFLDAVERVAAGGSALDPEVVRGLLAPTRVDDPVSALSTREREVLALVAEGRSNASIAASLVVAERTVETHMRSIFQKLRIVDVGDRHRRVMAVLAFMRARSAGAPGDDATRFHVGDRSK